MPPSKSIPRVKPNGNCSFGGHNQPSSGRSLHAGSNISESVLSSLSAASTTFSLQDEEFPGLGQVGACPSSATANSASPKVVSHRGGSFSGVQTERMPSALSKSHMPSTSLKSSTGSTQIPHGAEQEDDVLHNVSFKNKRKGPTRKHAADVGEDEGRTSASQDRIYFLGRLLTSILRHKASYLKLQIRNDGYVLVSDMLKLDVKTRPGIPLSAYSADDILKAVERDGKQRFTLLTENGVLLIRANQGHSIKSIESDKLLKPILSSDEIPGMRSTSEVLIYLDSKKALQDGMNLYMSDNGVILTEGFEGVVPPEYFERIAKWDNGKITPLPLNVKA